MKNQRLLDSLIFIPIFFGISVFAQAPAWRLLLGGIPFFHEQPQYIEHVLIVLRLLVFFSLAAILVKKYDKMADQEKLKLEEKFQNMISHFSKLFEKPSTIYSSELTDIETMAIPTIVKLKQWSELTINFVDNQKCEFITTNGYKKVLDFKEVGLADNRVKSDEPKPRSEWKYLIYQIKLTAARKIKTTAKLQDDVDTPHLTAELRKSVNKHFTLLFGIDMHAFSGVNNATGNPDHTQIKLSMNDTFDKLVRRKQISYDDKVDYRSKDGKVATQKNSE